MHSTAIDRRAALAALAGGLVLPFTAGHARAGASRRLYLNARADGDDRFLVSGFDGAGALAFDLPLPGRGHSFALHPARRLAVHFARRPGSFARVLDLARGAEVAAFETPEGRHFYGHGAFSPDGRLLYATENDVAGERGVLGVYDAAEGYRRVGELPSHGIGPHELRLLADGTTLAVANGGILTDPALPRVKLNLPTMEPSLVYLDRRDGRLLHRVRLAPSLHRLSIRHLAVAPDGTVAFVMQYEGPEGDVVPLVGSHRGREAPVLFEAPDATLRAMGNYCGSAAFDSSGAILAASAPRGGRITFWDLQRGRHLVSVPVEDGCGVAPAAVPRTFLVSSGAGDIFAVDTRDGTREALASRVSPGAHWDNHMVLAADL